jgi:CubicO group peptidase (beta-lactamase class C family)
MAPERLAIFALSVAFTASVVLYPDLPPDIPPQAGRHGPFVGAPFVAFFLPATAIVLWWLIAALSRRSPTVDPRGVRAGAGAAFLLCAFHVTMLTAFIGEQPWLVRVLGVVIGAFLIATGNDLPRARPAMRWGVRGAETLETENPVLSRDRQRAAGYVRVLMGLVLCAAAVLGVRRFHWLIFAAVCIEGSMRVAVAAVAHRRKTAVVGAALIACCAISGRAHAQAISTDRIDALPAFMDVTVPKLMDAGHVPGTAIAVVYRGRVVLLRGYGYADVKSRTRVHPSRTVFHIGSVSKTLTAIAVLQLVEAGRLDLHKDIRAYIPEMPLRYGATMHQLLTHTAGLEERSAGTSTDRPDYIATMSDRVWRHPPEQIVPPGSVYSYANSHYALAGRVIERVSGVPYAQYMAEHVFAPLAMVRTTAYQPPPMPLAADLTSGYRWRGGRYEALGVGFGYESAAGGIMTTASDMSRIMMALLGDGSVDGRRLLSGESVRTMLAPQYTPDPRISATAYGFMHWRSHGQDLLHKDGTAGGQIGVMVLDPAHELGVFAASNELPGVANHILEPLLTDLFGPEAPAVTPTALANAPDASRLAGWYRDYHHTRNEMTRAIALMLQSRVAVEPDRAIRWRARRWVQVAPLVFTSSDGRDTIVFRENASGKITSLHAWGATYERIGWTEQRPVHLGFLAVCLIAFLAYPISRIRFVLRRRPASDEGRSAQRCAVFVGLANLSFVAWLVV